MQNADARRARARHFYVGVVDAVLDVTVSQVIVKLTSCHNSAVILGFFGRSTQVGNCYYTGGVDDLFGGEVGNVCRNLTVSESCLELLGIDEVCTGEVDDLNTVFHFCNAFGANHILGLFGCGNVQGDIISLFKNLIIGSRAADAVIEVPSTFNREEGVAADNVHAKVNCGVGNLATNRAKADNAKRFAHQLGACKFGFAFFHLLCNVLGQSVCPSNAANYVTRCQEERANSQFLNAVCVSTGSVENNNTAFGATFNRNVINACTGTCDSLERGSERHLVHHGRAHHNTVGIFYIFAYVVAIIELVEANSGNFI